MANHKSAEKRVRQTKKRTVANKAKKSELKTIIKNVREAISSSDKSAAQTLLAKAQVALSKLGRKNVISSKNASRVNSRLNSQVNKI